MSSGTPGFSLNPAEAWTLRSSFPLLMLWQRRKPLLTLVCEQLWHGAAAKLVQAPSTLTGFQRTFCCWGCSAVCCCVLVACPAPANPLGWSRPWCCLPKAWQDDDAPLVTKSQGDGGGQSAIPRTDTGCCRSPGGFISGAMSLQCSSASSFWRQAVILAMGSFVKPQLLECSD